MKKWFPTCFRTLTFTSGLVLILMRNPKISTSIKRGIHKTLPWAEQMKTPREDSLRTAHLLLLWQDSWRNAFYCLLTHLEVIHVHDYYRNNKFKTWGMQDLIKMHEKLISKQFTIENTYSSSGRTLFDTEMWNSLRDFPEIYICLWLIRLYFVTYT